MQFRLDIDEIDIAVIDALFAHSGSLSISRRFADGDLVRLDGSQIAALLAAGSDEPGSIGDLGAWSDRACLIVAGRLGWGIQLADEAWWEACQMVADSAAKFDLIADAAFAGTLHFTAAPATHPT